MAEFEHNHLSYDQTAAVERVIAQALQHGSRQTEKLPDGSEAYAYPHPGPSEGIAWGVNAARTGFCIARDIRR